MFDGNHGHYFNADKNLISLDFVVLAETKLSKERGINDIECLLNNWKVLGRYDSEDQRKHMGLILLSSRISKFNGEVSITHQTAKRDGNLQIEGMILRLKCNLKFGFVYCRSSPTYQEIKAINKYFEECNVLMGDFNLSHRDKQDQNKITNLCQQSKFSSLKEITRSISQNQLDYILIDDDLRERSFVTSFHNFISDHKSITVRIGFEGSTFSKEFEIKRNFDKESHLKTKFREGNEDIDSSSSSSKGSFDKDFSETDYSSEEDVIEDNDSTSVSQFFRRRFKNIDMSSCWLNSCLQLVLSALDHSITPPVLNSDLGNELQQLQINRTSFSLNPTMIKNTLVTTEDTRIALRLSELELEINDENELRHQVELVEKSRLDLLSGQQCVKDFFICFQTNTLSWPDVSSILNFNVTESTECCACNSFTSSETSQLYVEIEVPPDNSHLNESVEEFFNISELFAMNCENCKNLVQKDKRLTLTSASEAEFITVILRRAVETLDGYEFNKQRTIPTDDVFIR